MKQMRYVGSTGLHMWDMHDIITIFVQSGLYFVPVIFDPASI